MLMYNLLDEYQNCYYAFLDADEFFQYSSVQMPQFVDYVLQQTIDQDKVDLWYDLKICRITSSIIYEVTRCHTPNGNLVDRILGKVKPVPQTYQMQRGTNLQREVIDVVSKELNTRLSPCGLLLDPRYPAIGASPDAIGPDFVVEIKCPVSKDNFKNYLHPEKDYFLKSRYYSQIQLQMNLKKVDFGYFLIAHPDFELTKKVDIIRVDYNDKYTKKMIKDATKFWKANIYPEMLKSIVQ